MSGWAVQVSEPRLSATGRGDEWWVAYRRAMPPERFTEEKSTPVGAIVTVACDDQVHAVALAALFVAQDMPRTAVTVISPRRHTTSTTSTRRKR